jgi:hypothetical protein
MSKLIQGVLRVLSSCARLEEAYADPILGCDLRLLQVHGRACLGSPRRRQPAEVRFVVEEESEEESLHEVVLGCCYSVLAETEECWMPVWPMKVTSLSVPGSACGFLTNLAKQRENLSTKDKIKTSTSTTLSRFCELAARMGCSQSMMAEMPGGDIETDEVTLSPPSPASVSCNGL